jgi:hypothetical protein
MLTAEHLSPSLSRTLRPVFGQEFLFSFVFLFLAGHSSSLYLSVRQDDIRTSHFSIATTTSTLTSATLVIRGYHLRVILIDFYSRHNIRAIMTLQLRGGGMSAHQILTLTYSPVSPSMVLPLRLRGMLEYIW